MAAGNETNAFVRDGSMLEHHTVDTSSTPNSWKPIYPYTTKYGDDYVRYLNADGDVDMWGSYSHTAAKSVPMDVTLPVAISNPKLTTVEFHDILPVAAAAGSAISNSFTLSLSNHLSHVRGNDTATTIGVVATPTEVDADYPSIATAGWTLTGGKLL